MTRPVFLISLPRSGSTLLQSMLSVSPDIALCAEPWIMLPLLHMRNPHIARAAYFHYTAADAINDFVSRIPDGETHYDSAISGLAMNLYEAAAQGRRYFLDKTPRYYLVIPELQRLFPNALFILLVRHPLAVLASIAETFNRGHFRWFDYWLDWIEGHRCLAAGVRNITESCRVVSYEKLVTDPVSTVSDLCGWMDITFTDDMVSSYSSSELRGRMGDKKGLKQYKAVSHRSLDKWRRMFATSHRKAVARAMIRRLNPDDLHTLGYPPDYLLRDVDAIKTKRTLDLSGRVDTLVNWIAYYVDFRYLQARYRAAKHGSKYAYGFYRRH